MASEKKEFLKLLIGLGKLHKKSCMGEFEELGLTAGQPKVLSVLQEKEGYLQKNLAARCSVEPATMTVLINNMEEKGLVRREKVYVSGGKRAFAIYLTDKGKETAQVVAQIVEKTDNLCFKGIEDKKEDFLATMRQIIKNLSMVVLACLTALTLSACGSTNGDVPMKNETLNETTASDNGLTNDASANTVDDSDKAVPTQTSDDVQTAGASDNTEVAEASDKPQTAETKSVKPDPNGPKVHEPAQEIPAEYLAVAPDGFKGTVEKVSYMTKDYSGDGSPLEKETLVYLPAGYDDSKQYNVLYLLHGIGGNINEWGMGLEDESKVVCMMNNLAAKGDIDPFIVVTPNGRSGAKFESTSFDVMGLFYEFGKELRNDLIPFIDDKYSTYATNDDGTPADSDEARLHRAVAGLSMGGMQSINIGMCECMDLFAWFGSFSAAPTSYPADRVVSIIEDEFPDKEICFSYNICGTDDTTAYASASESVKGLDALSDRFVSGVNYLWQEKPGGHGWDIWYLGFYNFAGYIFGNAK